MLYYMLPALAKAGRTRRWQNSRN